MHFDGLKWVVYAWTKEDGTPYFVSKCREGSKALYQNRLGTTQPPRRGDGSVDKNRVRILYKGSDEKECIERMDRFQYDFGVEEAAPGFGTLQNSIRHTPNMTKERGHSHIRPVTLWDLKGGKVGDYPSVGIACSIHNLNSGNACSVLNGSLYQTGGFVITQKGEKFRKRPRKQRAWVQREVVGLAPDKQIHRYSSITEASLAISGGREKKVGIYQSLNSPTEQKRSVKGWMFFLLDEFPEDIADIKQVRRGRPGKKDGETQT